MFLNIRPEIWVLAGRNERRCLTIYRFSLGLLGLFECKNAFMSDKFTSCLLKINEIICLGDLYLTWCFIYLDDITVHSWMEEEYQTGSCIQQEASAGLKLKTSNFQLFQNHIS